MAMAPAAVGAPTHEVDGLVIAVDSPVMTVAHRPISGYMQAMTMDFRVANPGQLSKIRPGMRVRFRWRNNLAFDVRHVPADESDMPVTTRQPAVGEPAPEFQLTDQLGRTVTLGGLRGKIIALNFLYTRCPMPEVCPRLAASFAMVQRKLQPAMGKDLVLVSITIDPEWDTPQVLAAYAKLWRANPQHWLFLTGSPGAVKNVATAWGLIYWPEDFAITHTSRTAIIGRDGNLAAMIEGTSYRADQLVELVRRQLEAPR
jgi:protein SCO1